MEDKQHAKRFNQGYLLAQHSPELSKQLIVNLKKQEKLTDQDKALMAGMSEFDKEFREYEKPQNFMPPKGRTETISDKTKEKGIEPEME